MMAMADGTEEQRYQTQVQADYASFLEDAVSFFCLDFGLDWIQSNWEEYCNVTFILMNYFVGCGREWNEH